MNVLNTPLFGVVLSIGGFMAGHFIYARVKSPLCNPLLIAIVLIIGFLMVSGTPLEVYQRGGDLILFFLSPATVILAVPLYRKIDLLRRHGVAIIGGVVAGSVMSLVSVVVLSWFFHLNDALCISLLPKSVTAPIGIELSRQLGGIGSITIAAIVVTGVTGAVVSPIVVKVFGIRDEVAQGIAIGTAAHAVGTSKAVEMGETVGAMSGLAIGIAGLVTVFLGPVVVRFLG